MDDISVVHHKLIGLNFLNEEAGSQVRALWVKRFDERSTFWVDAPASATTDSVYDDICNQLTQQGIHSMNRESCIFSMFLDLTNPLTRQQLDILAELPNRMHVELGCTITFIFEFTYLGQLRKEQRSDLRERLAQLSAENTSPRCVNIQRQICVVAKPRLAGTSLRHWQAAIVTMDILRRRKNVSSSTSVAGSGGANNDVCFLRYGEYDDQLRAKLIHRQGELEKLLGDGGETEFRIAVGKCFQSLEDKIEKEVSFSASSQPLHHDMYINGFGLFSGVNGKRSRARQGKYPPFNAAQEASLEAVQATGDEITTMALAIGRKLAEQAPALLQDMLERSGVGIRLEGDRARMEHALNVSLEEPTDLFCLSLRYNEDGYTQEIQSYFDLTLRRAVYEAKKTLRGALQAAYGAITADGLRSREDALRNELNQVKHELSLIPTEKDFCSSVGTTGELMNYSFNPKSAMLHTIPQRYLLCLQEQTAQRLSGTYEVPGGLTVLLVNGAAAGLKSMDTPPIVGLHILSFDCSDMLLHTLIPEVD